MTIYIDNEFKCHVSPAEGLTPVETDFFDGKSEEYVKGYRFIPSGETWTREDGEIFAGEMVSPWRDWRELDAAQRAYEREQLAEAQAALAILEVEK